MLPAQRSQLGDDERDLIVSAALSKSPKQVASMALKIDSVKDEIILNLMGFLMSHYSFRQMLPLPSRYAAAAVPQELSRGGDEDDDVDDSDDTSDGDHSSEEVDDGGHEASRVSWGDDRAHPELSAAEAARRSVGDSGSSRFPHSSADPMELGWQQPAGESPGGDRRRLRSSSRSSANAGSSMAPVPVWSAAARWTPAAAAAAAGGALLCFPTCSTPELARASTAAGSALALTGHAAAASTAHSTEPTERTAEPQNRRQQQQPQTSAAPAAAAEAGSLPSLAEASADGRPGFTCSHCGRYFKNAEALKFHAAKHLGVEYQCPLCKQRLKTSNSYSNHMKMHSGYDGHRCSVCHKHFMRRHEMVRHVKIVHMGERPFACPDCGAAFATDWNMLRHRKAMHSAGSAPAAAAAGTSDGSAAAASAAGGAAVVPSGRGIAEGESSGGSVAAAALLQSLQS